MSRATTRSKTPVKEGEARPLVSGKQDQTSQSQTNQNPANQNQTDKNDKNIVISAQELRKIYRLEGGLEVHALRGLDLAINRGEYVAIMGPSGSGKSTLLQILGCLDTPTSGSYKLAGEEVSGLSEDELSTIRNRRIGFIFQAYNLLSRADALHNVALPLMYRGTPPRERTALAKEALARVGLANRLDHRPNQLSGGQKQRVAIARALATDPDILLADEPTGNLDSRTGEEILGLFAELHAEGRTVVMVTHEQDVAEHCQKIVRVLDGQVERVETVKERRHAVFTGDIP